MLHGINVVDFKATWCEPCRDQEPIIDELELTCLGKATVSKINIDAHRDIALRLGIQSIPTIIIFNEGEEVCRFIGFQTADSLHTALNSLLQCDESYAWPHR